MKKDTTNNTIIRTFFIDPSPMTDRAAVNGIPVNNADYSYLGANWRHSREKSEALEQEVYDMYVVPLIKEYNLQHSDMQIVLNDIAYGVDENSNELGMGERAAVWHSLMRSRGKSATGDWWSFAMIVNGRNPLFEDPTLAKESREAFVKIYDCEPSEDSFHDRYALDIMTYGLRQGTNDRSLAKERTTLVAYQKVFGILPESTFDWNVLQTMTYAGVER